MPDLQPIYTPQNVTFAYQLRWAMTLFTVGNRPPIESIAPVAQALEKMVSEYSRNVTVNLPCCS